MTLKKSIPFALVLAIMANYLFYPATLALNALVFSAISSVFLYYSYPDLSIKKRLGILTPHLLSAIYISFYPQGISYAFWFISFFMTWAQAGARDSALWLPMQTFLSILVAPFKHWGTQEVAEGSTEPKTKSGVIVLRILVIAILVVIFASLYIGSNPALQNVLDYFPWQRINGAAFLRVLFYFLLFFGLVHFYVVPAFPKWKAREGNIPTPEKIAEGSDNEWATAKWSFIILSIVLGIINLMDLVFILGGELPDGTSYSGYVHQGFFSLVFSMMLAIALILIFFRGDLNFHERLGSLKKVAILWVSQNLVLGLITAYKNFMYVDIYGFTYKRIAVFLFLISVIVGLILAYQKIEKKYSTWDFLNRASIATYLALFTFSLVPYDLLISRYNAVYPEHKDIYYVLRLRLPDFNALKEMAKNHSGDEYVQDRVTARTDGNYYIHSQDWREWSYYHNHYSKSDSDPQ